MITEISVQLGLTQFIVVTRTTTGILKMKYIGGKPGMTTSEKDRRREIIKNAFDMFNQNISPISIDYDVSRSAGIIRIAREAS